MPNSDEKYVTVRFTTVEADRLCLNLELALARLEGLVDDKATEQCVFLRAQVANLKEAIRRTAAGHR